MGNQRFEVDALGGDHINKLPHPFLAAGASGREDFKTAYSLAKSLDRNREIMRVDANTRQRTGRTQSLKGIFEGRLSTECLDGNVHATTGGEAHDFFNGIYLSEINRVIRTERFCRL